MRHLSAATVAGQLAALFPFARGGYRVDVGVGAEALQETLPLRQLCFRANGGNDLDRFDATCLHLRITDIESGSLVLSCRLNLLDAINLDQSYCGQFYGLSRLQGFGAATIEIGRFALHPDRHDPDILRLAWAAIARLVDTLDVGLLFGCASFAGAEVAPHIEALRWLHSYHQAPQIWAPSPIHADAVVLAGLTGGQGVDMRAAMQTMPPLLRSYLAMGGWVSDHAVIDSDLDTLHVFTAVEIDKIPAARARALREIAALG